MLVVKITSNQPYENDFCINNADTGFMIVATAFVMLQTPAMGICQSGMIQRKNSLSILMQTMTGLIIGSLLWYIFGIYYFGNFGHIFIYFGI